MHLIVLAVPDCPNVKLLDQRLAQLLKGRPDVAVSHRVVEDPDEAARRGMHGSPTLLVDGIDPFADPGQHASVSCRLYRGRYGRPDGAPSLRQLRQAISNPVSIVADTGDGGWLDALGGGSRGRMAPAERGLRAVHQLVLRSFAATGGPPEQDLLDEAARPFDSRQVLAELADGDYLCLGQDGRITAAYPFSATATPHTVQITGGAVAYSMCAPSTLWAPRKCWARACWSSLPIRQPASRSPLPSTEAPRYGNPILPLCSLAVRPDRARDRPRRSAAGI